MNLDDLKNDSKKEKLKRELSHGWLYWFMSLFLLLLFHYCCYCQGWARRCHAQQRESPTPIYARGHIEAIKGMNKVVEKFLALKIEV